MTLEERVEILEKNYNNLAKSLVDAQRCQRPVVDKADSASNKIPQVDANTVGVAGNEDAICELSELVDESIAELEQAICDLSEEIGG